MSETTVPDITFVDTAASRRPHRSQARLWTIQALILAVTVAHGALELASRHDELRGALAGLEDLPIQLFVVPMVLAGYWYGLTGALWVGAVAMVLSIPNLIAFHTADFAWLGELLTGSAVLAVGIVVGLVAERAATTRLTAEETQRRLTTLQRVSVAVTRHDSVPDLVRAVLEALVTADGVVAASLVGTTDAASAITDGRQRALFESGTALWVGEASPTGDIASAPVEAQGERLGVLTVYTDGTAPAPTAVILHVARDLSFAVDRALERQQNRTNLERHARAVTDAQEVERRRVARDLHDGPAQSLVVLERGLRHLAAIEREASVAREVEDLAMLANETRQAIRDTMSALRPSLLDDLGLVPALQSLAERASTQDVDVTMRFTGSPRRLGDLVEIASYRIVQEALTNAVEHSGGRTVEISVGFDPDRVTVVIADDGSGFGQDATRGEKAALGILGMRERADIVGGSLEITTGPAGTTVSFTAPG